MENRKRVPYYFFTFEKIIHNVDKFRCKSNMCLF